MWGGSEEDRTTKIVKRKEGFPDAFERTWTGIGGSVLTGWQVEVQLFPYWSLPLERMGGQRHDLHIYIHTHIHTYKHTHTYIHT